MVDNVVKFRRVDRKPEPKAPPPRGPRKPPQWPAWLPWAVIVGAAVLFTLAQNAGLLGG
jgi:hypothetical protein